MIKVVTQQDIMDDLRAQEKGGGTIIAEIKPNVKDHISVFDIKKMLSAKKTERDIILRWNVVTVFPKVKEALFGETE